MISYEDRTTVVRTETVTDVPTLVGKTNKTVHAADFELGFNKLDQEISTESYGPVCGAVRYRNARGPAVITRLASRHEVTCERCLARLAEQG